MKKTKSKTSSPLSSPIPITELKEVFPLTEKKLATYKRSFASNGFCLDYFIMDDKTVEFLSSNKSSRSVRQTVMEYARTYFDVLFGTRVLRSHHYSLETIWKDEDGKYHMFVRFDPSLFDFRITNAILEGDLMMPSYVTQYNSSCPCLFIASERLNLAVVVPLSVFEDTVLNENGFCQIRVAQRLKDHDGKRKGKYILFYTDDFAKSLFVDGKGNHPSFLCGRKFSRTSIATFVRSFGEFQDLRTEHTRGKLSYEVIYSAKTKAKFGKKAK